MKKLVLGLLMSLFAVSGFALPMVSLNPSSTLLTPNAPFTVDVLVDGIEVLDPLIAFGFDVSTGGGVSLVDAAVAPPFFDDSAAFATTAVAGSTLPAVSGDGILLATLSLNAGFAPGLWDIVVTSTGTDFGISEGLFTRADTSAVQAITRVEVIGDAAVPLSSTLTLLLLGLIFVKRLQRG